jgi:mRNA interferase RelE/StbE
MAWDIELSRAAERDLDKLDKQTATRILSFLYDRVVASNDPRSIGEALKGSKLGNLWKYRVGNYRIVSEIQDGVLLILVLKIGHRREVYR